METVAASFRDPSGFVLKSNGEFLRVINECYRDHYNLLLQSGLYDRLLSEKLLLPHEELPNHRTPGAWKVIRPRQLTFVSYPYEWSFGQWKDAALATLRIQELAVNHGMALKDASAFNIQFVDGRPTLIDTLSFEALETPKPWVAYGQFCRHFLAPLALMAHCDVRLGQWSRIHIDGVPLDLASALLPGKTRFKPWLLMHLHWHAASQRRPRGHEPAKRNARYSMQSLKGTVQTLASAVKGLHWEPPKTAWASYYAESVTPGRYVGHKKEVVAEYLDQSKPRSLWDLGANTGLFSRLATARGINTIAFDSDAACVEINYREARKSGDALLLPLFVDLVNPTPAIGWDLHERMSWFDRSQPDLVMALAVVHHLAIGNNVPLDRIAAFFARIAPRLIVEFVPKDDPNARKLLEVREDIFPHYTQSDFEREFARHFVLERQENLHDSERILYLMKRL